MPRIEGVPSRASVVGHIDGSAVAKTSNLGADLPFGADLGLQVGVTKVGGNEPRSELGREWCERRELVERPGLEPRLPDRTPKAECGERGREGRARPARQETRLHRDARLRVEDALRGLAERAVAVVTAAQRKERVVPVAELLLGEPPGVDRLEKLLESGLVGTRARHLEPRSGECLPEASFFLGLGDEPLAAGNEHR